MSRLSVRLPKGIAHSMLPSQTPCAYFCASLSLSLILRDSACSVNMIRALCETGLHGIIQFSQTGIAVEYSSQSIGVKKKSMGTGIRQLGPTSWH